MSRYRTKQIIAGLVVGLLGLGCAAGAIAAWSQDVPAAAAVAGFFALGLLITCPILAVVGWSTYANAGKYVAYPQ